MNIAPYFSSVNTFRNVFIYFHIIVIAFRNTI
nr:MAG TPA: hypothetical protein [Caudoviricetes sp.]DAR97710.1 MAG TPA: hypothetical protein [Caudoviricetes sp.]